MQVRQAQPSAGRQHQVQAAAAAASALLLRQAEHAALQPSTSATIAAGLRGLTGGQTATSLKATPKTGARAHAEQLALIHISATLS